MRYLAAILFGLAAIDAPVPGLDRAGVALLGLAAIALSLSARPSVLERIEQKPRPPAIFGLDDELEQELSEATAAASSYLNGRGARA